MTRTSSVLVVSTLSLLAACTGPQSALSPAGRDAERLYELFILMAIGAVAIWLAVVGLTLHASRLRSRPYTDRQAHVLILGGGVLFPVVVLTVLLVYGLRPLPEVLALPPPGGMSISIVGHQWWWRVTYHQPDGTAFELANEIRLPVGRRVEVRLTSADVIHSFWVPSLTGKMDMVPGRVTRIALEPTRTGTFRGACAEYCGASHSFMSLFAVVLGEAEFERWAAGQQDAARPPSEPAAVRGQAGFLANGCGACHTVRGTSASGRVGPDLTHVGSRVSLGAGLLENTPGNLQRWIAVTERVKPGVHMPSFDMLDGDDLVPIAAYLSGLR